MFCESDGRVLGGMRFRVLVEVLFCEIDGRVKLAVWGGGATAVLGCWGSNF